MSRKILITGSNGLLGQKLLHILDRNSHELAGIDLVSESFISDVEHQYHRVDLTDRRLTIDAITAIEPQIIIHTAALTEVDKCEQQREACWNINVKATDHLITAAKKIDAKVIFVSSDYIFDGKKGPYNENDLPCPVNYYGKSKLAAENILRGSDLNWAIVRTIVLYGVGIKVHASFVTWLLG
ncbi:MAG: sugar nucleotide-binding protein, partial [Calditrichaeota bacterium]|nr:sugar nucleotide-binding protein [Calditrichota bacterium]